MREKLPLHGRSHLSGGSDPIPGLGGSGIQFDTYPQDGNWLYIKTTSFDPTTGNGLDIIVDGGNDMVVDVQDSTALKLQINTGDAQILLREDAMEYYINSGESVQLVPHSFTANVTNAFIDLTETGGFVARIPSGGSSKVTTSVDQYFQVDDNGSNVGKVRALTGYFAVESRFPHNPFFIVDDAGDTATTVQVKDNAGNLIFQIDDDGTLHGLTGATLVFDL